MRNIWMFAALAWVAVAAAYADQPVRAKSTGLVRTWHGEGVNPFYFDGTRAISVPDAPELDLPDGSAWTLEAWIFPTAPGGMHVAGKRGICAGGDGFYQIGRDRSPPGKGMGIDLADSPTNTWTHVALAADGVSGWTVYANGVAVKRVEQPGWRIQNSGPFRIGGAGTCAPFVGLIDEVSLYSRALSADEVRIQYAAAAHGANKPFAFAECENADCAAGHINGNVGTWTFQGRHGIAVWPRTGAVSTLEIERFTPTDIVVRRTNAPNSHEARGLTALYEGTIEGDQINGTVTWVWSGFKLGVAHGMWHAKLGSDSEQQELLANQRTVLASLDTRRTPTDGSDLLLLLTLGAAILGTDSGPSDDDSNLAQVKEAQRRAQQNWAICKEYYGCK